MYIKTLTIQGFKSYRDQTQIEPFSSRHNVVVGRNGSGKSNFFAAIRFVLSDAYTSMSREERQALLHEGVAGTPLSAYVEIVFDNSDNRFPTGKDEVILRRTIGLKKDEYSLDKKSASKADVMNLLESAGFSKSNPYYIVPQGRITALTNAKDHERLALLKEVAGTKVYEQRRTESIKIMTDTEAKRSKIVELLEFIDGRLNELEEEKEELKEFQSKDKERRCLEYALHSRELNEVSVALEEIEEDRKGELHNANVRREAFDSREKDIKRIENSITEAKHELQSHSAALQSTQQELEELVRTRTEIACVIADLRSSGEGSADKRQSQEVELNRVQQLIAQREAELQQIVPQWNAQRASEAAGKRQLDEANAKMGALFSKQGRATKFRTRAERDAYLRSEIESVRSYHAAQTTALGKAHEDLAAAQQRLQELTDRIAEVRERMENSKAHSRNLEVDIIRLKEEQLTAMENRKDLWREDTKLDSLTAHAHTELSSAERVLTSMMDKDTGMGLRAIDKIAEKYELDGVYGPLYRLFKITDPKFNTAVELTAGNSLFHVVVDTDETAAKVLEIMMKERAGRVTFMPLNRLHPKDIPTLNAQDAIPLIDKLEFDPQYLKAFQQVFGKTVVCRDLTIAAAYVKSHGVNTITLDGDKVDRKGALTGGYHDVRRSRIDAIANVSTWRAKWDAENARSKEVKAGIIQLDQSITQMTGRISQLNTQINQGRESRDRMQTEGIAFTSDKEATRAKIQSYEKDIGDLEAELTRLNTNLADYANEMQAPMAQGLSTDEEMLLENLGREVEAISKQLAEVAKNRNELEGQKNRIEIELSERLKRRELELVRLLESPERAGDGDVAEDIDSRQRELARLNRSIDTLTDKKADMEKEGEELANKLQQLKANLESVQNQQQEDSRSINRQQKNTERYLAKRQMLLNRKDECNRNIRDLGVLPEEAFEKYVNENMNRLVKKLHTVNEGLKKFAHVNKKAFEQYNNFTKQRDQLLERREELDKSAKSIDELVQNLDQRKDEAIERTFKQVASNFEEVFQQLVPAGRGRLIIQRRIDQDEEMEESQQGSIDNYTGVAIKVSFNSKVDEGLRIQQLSGGQKSLVALATVFAIQKCDPAPFYLFDEIDANLDAQYRTAVATMIQTLSSTAQFIVTTFRPEMLQTADKFYGVLFNNQKVSSIRSIKREEAMEFIDQEQQAQ